MITKYKIFESDNKPWISIDDNLAIFYHKAMGPDDKKEGQVKIYIRNNNLQNWKKLTIAAGAAKLLDTKYENNEKLRNMSIPFKPANWNISQVTQISIIRTIIGKAYPDYPINLLRKRSEMLTISYSFHFWNNIINVGQLMDKLKEYREEIVKGEKTSYDEWDMKRQANKYNI